MEHPQQIFVNRTVFHLRGPQRSLSGIAAVILNRNAICQFIIGQHITIPVKNAAARTVQASRLDNTHQIVRLAVSSVDDL